MTTDKLTNALIALLEPIKPDASITVVDARAISDIDLPTIAVDVGEPERHSLALPGVMKCPVEITLRAHSGDGVTRDTLKAWADAIERNINGTINVASFISGSGLGVQCDYFQMDGGSTRWEETTFEASFTAEAWIQRTS
jgi:hypothetical protein